MDRNMAYVLHAAFSASGKSWLTVFIHPQAITHPVRVNPIPRQIPPQPKYLRPWVRVYGDRIVERPFLNRHPPDQAATILAGILPFGACVT